MSLPLLPFAIFGLGGPELMIILVIILLLFGGAKLPALAKGLGQSVKEFKKAAKEGDDDNDDKKPDAGQKPGNN
ncbi:MAG: twin-arginine translocase TatA/TatE family subunit [Lacunisphaera sp.]|nr:twin-arginine translocase TatA/TatE family subunit [Lacunisphaera sp.]